MENAVQKILRYLLRLNSKACQKTQKTLSLIISVKVETLKHSTDFLPCVISISVGGNAVKQYISEELQNGFLMALTSLPISVIPHREDYYCPHYLTEEFIFSFAFQVTDRRQELKKSYCKIQQLLHRISIVNPEIILHCCVKIDTFVSLKTFDTTEENFAQQHGISLLVGRENYSRSENNEASLDCPKLHPIFGPSCKLHVTANMKKMSFTGGMTLKLVAVLKPSINKLSYKPSTMSSFYVSSMPLCSWNNKIAFLSNPDNVGNWKKYNLSLSVNPNLILNRDFVIPDVIYDAVSISDNSCDYFVKEKQDLLLFFFLDYKDEFYSEVGKQIEIHQTILHEMNQILFLNQFTVKDCVQSIIDRALEDTNRAQSNYQKLQSAACVTAEALSSIILISTNQTFRKSCYSNLKVCKTRSVISPIQSMYINSVYSQVSITGGACDIEKDVTAVTRVHSHGIMNGMNGSSSQSNDSYEEEEEEGSVLGCSSHCLKKRRCIMETSREDSYQTQQKNTDYLSNDVIQFSYLHGRTCEYDTENLTSIESQASAESTSQEEEDPWLREVCNLAFW